MDEIGVNFISQTQTDPSDRSDPSDKSDSPTPVSPPFKGGFGRVFYFKIILIRAVTSLTLISPSPLMSHTASE